MRKADDNRPVPPFQKKTICVAGITTVDAVARTVDDFPPPGGLRMFDSLVFSTGGNATNAAIALARMGLATDVILKVGSDAPGDFIRSELARHGLPTDGVIRGASGHTSYSFVMVHRDGQRSFFHTRGTNATFTLEEFQSALTRRSDLLFLTGTMLMPALDGPPMVELLRGAKSEGNVTLLDTNYVDAATRDQWQNTILPCLPYVDYFLPSRLEADAITGLHGHEAQAEYFLSHGCQAAVIKLDAHGAFGKTTRGDAVMVPSYRVSDVVDTTGAGDCWCAGFLAGLAMDESFENSIRLGNAVAAHCIRHPGASNGIPALDEIRLLQNTTPCGG